LALDTTAFDDSAALDVEQAVLAVALDKTKLLVSSHLLVQDSTADDVGYLISCHK
jgi:hypothetical protein